MRSSRPCIPGWLKIIQVKTVAFIEPNDASGWSVEKDCRRNAEKNNLKIVFSQFYERGTSDFYPLLNKLILQNPDVIDFTGAPPGDQALIVKQARELGYKGKTFSATTMDPPEFCKIAGTQNAEGHISNTHDLFRRLGKPKVCRRLPGPIWKTIRSGNAQIYPLSGDPGPGH